MTSSWRRSTQQIAKRIAQRGRRDLSPKALLSCQCDDDEMLVVALAGQKFEYSSIEFLWSRPQEARDSQSTGLRLQLTQACLCEFVRAQVYPIL